MNINRNAWLFLSSVIVLGLLALLGITHLLDLLLFELRGSFHSDVGMYMTVARGWLQGLMPYVDLFENKTPGVFAMAAMSLQFFGDHRLLTWIEVTTLGLIPLVIGLSIFAIMRTHGRVRLGYKKMITALIGFIFGCTCALFAGIMAGQLLPESFGAFFAIAFVCILALHRDRFSFKTETLLALLFLLSIAAKEPFALPIMGSSLILMPPKKVIRTLTPICIAALIGGTIGLLLLGVLLPYISVHLGFIFSFHIFHPWGTLDEPWWLRTIDVVRIARHLASLSIFFPLLIASVWLGALAVLLRNRTTTHDRMLTIGRWLLASWFTTAAVGITGDFYGHHFVVALPFYVACFLLCIREVPTLSTFAQRTGLMLITILSAATLFTMDPGYSNTWIQWQQWERPRARAAQTLDTVMDRCGFHRYFNFIDRAENGIFAFTKHVPYGPIFNQYARFIGARTEYLDGFATALETAPILLMRTPEEGVMIGADTQAFLQSTFTETAPPCAGKFVQPLPYRILFRRNENPPT